MAANITLLMPLIANVLGTGIVFFSGPPTDLAYLRDNTNISIYDVEQLSPDEGRALAERNKVLVEARTIEPELDQHSTDGTAHKDAGESRASGGLQTDPSHTPWLGVAWQKKNPTVDYKTYRKHNKPEDGFMVGHSIALPKDHHILHKDTAHDIVKIEQYNPGLGPLKVYTWSEHPAAAKLNVLDGPNVDRHSDVSFPGHIKNLGNSPFALYNHSRFNLDDKRLPYKDNKPISKFATFEHDKNNFGTDCHAHVWSRSPLDVGSRGVPFAERWHAKFPVSVNKSSCTSEGTADRGAPILCGKEQKVTYLVAPSRKGCDDTAVGYHVGHLVPHINSHDSTILG